MVWFSVYFNGVDVAKVPLDLLLVRKTLVLDQQTKSKAMMVTQKYFGSEKTIQ